MNELKLARAGGVLGVLALTILALGLLIQIAGKHGALVALIPGGAGAVLVAVGAYLIALSRRPNPDLASAARLTRGAALVATAVVVVGVAATAIAGIGVMTTIILGLVGLQAPIGLRMTANFLAEGGRDR
ncbi:hypothetical protein CYK24_03785 [Trueperella bernardiae]|uniref:Uncharacterized protein n=1 Tax=Trueperella bernardiae TaxID=59561 RepID=A0AAW6ZL54_9ACTO|nr:hypothetical protein [Trueperella bernardiae]MDK8601458.1 hypothetical protein [Trueperella bernardiae]PKZ89418.1 hypothetical protein CYK24_03785 [Trueperella bernardiae]